MTTAAKARAVLAATPPPPPSSHHHKAGGGDGAAPPAMTSPPASAGGAAGRRSGPPTPAPAAEGRAAVLLRRSASSSSGGALAEPGTPLTLEHGARGGGRRSGLVKGGAPSSSPAITNSGSGKLVVQPDGNVLWEMPADALPAVGGLLRGAAELALVLSAASSGIMGVAVAVVELKRASEHNYCLTSQHLARVMASTVSSSFAGTVAGLAYAPLLAARMLCGRLARPAAVAGAAWAAARGAARLLALRGASPAALLRRLEDAALALGGDALEAAERVAERAAASGRFRRAFARLGGVQALLGLLQRAGLDAASAGAVLRALAELLREADARGAIVAGGGVPFLLLGLTHPDAAVGDACAAMLARVAGAPDAQAALLSADDLDGAGGADGGGGGAPELLVRLLHDAADDGAAAAEELLAADAAGDDEAAEAAAAAVAADEPRVLHLVSVAAAVGGGSAAGAAALAAAGLPGALLRVAAAAPLPRTRAKEAALCALQSLASSSAAHFAALRAEPDARPRLDAAAAAYGGDWYASRGALRSLLAQMDAADAAPIAGDAPELVELELA